MNVVLHGFETALVNSLPKEKKPGVIRYADDFVILRHDLDTLLHLKQRAEAWLGKMGLNLKESKTRITYTLNEHEGKVGFDFLGFTIHQFKTGKYRSRLGFRTIIKPSKDAQKRHLAQMADVIKEHRSAPQTVLIVKLNRKIRAWSNYYRTCSFQHVFSRMDYQLHWKLRRSVGQVATPP